MNYASPAVLRAIGVPEGALLAILQAREGGVIEGPGLLASLGVDRLPGGLSLGSGGSNAYMVRATAQLKDRPIRRSVSALIRLGQDPSEPPVGVVRWYQTAN